MSGSPPRPGYLLPKTQIGFYEVIEQVGAGGMGALYKVKRDERIYALKIATYRLADLTPASRQAHEERADRELIAIKSLRHPNIVKVHAFEKWPDLHDGYPFLIMDFVEGKELYPWRAESTPSLRTICQLFRTLAQALHHMHSLDIFHRDFKSQNVLVNEKGQPIIVDFGIARPRAAYTLTHDSILGTYTHFTPEYCRHLNESGSTFQFSAATELHSVGYTLYELLTGRPPFGHTSDEDQLLKAIIEVEPPKPSKLNPAIPHELDEIVLRLLAKEPAARYQSGQELAVALEAAVERAGPAWDAPFDVPPPPPAGAAAPETTAATGEEQESARPLPVSEERPARERVKREGLEPPSAKSAWAGSAAGSGERLAVPAAGTLFRQPAEAASAFVSPSAEPKSPSSAAAADHDPASLGRAAEAVAATRHAGNRIQLKRLLPLAGAGAVAAVVLGLAATGRPKPAEQNLLSHVKESETETTAAADVAEKPALSLVPPPPEVASPRRPARPTSERDAQIRASREEEAARIDAAIRTTYGRPRIPPDSAPPARGAADLRAPNTEPAKETPPPEPTPWAPVIRKRSVAAATSKLFGVPTGAHIRARLKMNLDSRTVSNGFVEAELVRPFIVAGRAVFPSKTMLFGSAQAAGDRFTIRFTQLRLPDLTEAVFEGLAVDRSDLKPGLQASRRISASSPRESTGSKVAKNVATNAVGQLGGDLARDSARTAGHTVLQGTAQERDQASGAILLDAGLDFDVFVTKPF